MFFKKKIAVEDFCSDYLKTLFHPEIDLVYEHLRDACADPALSAAGHNLYLDHIRAVIIELTEIAITFVGWLATVLRATQKASLRQAHRGNMKDLTSRRCSEPLAA
jgi:hypothetical protein